MDLGSPERHLHLYGRDVGGKGIRSLLFEMKIVRKNVRLLQQDEIIFACLVTRMMVLTLVSEIS